MACENSSLVEFLNFSLVLTFIAYHQQKKFNKALSALTTILKSHLTIHSEKHHLVGSCLHSIGVVRMYSGKYKNAMVSFEGAIRIRKDALGKNHPDVAVSTNADIIGDIFPVCILFNAFQSTCWFLIF